MNVRFGAQIAQAALAHHLDPRLLAAVAAQETGGPGSNSGRNVVGDDGHGRGIFQIDDRSWAFARTPAAMDPAKNAEMAASILAAGLRTYGGDVRAALSAYNAGSPSAVGTRTTWPDGSTLGYADSVLRHYDALGGAVSANPEGVPSGPKAQSIASLVEQLLAAQQFDTTRAARGTPGGSAIAPAPFAQTAAWLRLTSAGANEGASADQAIADLVDAGDIFDGSPSDAN